MFFNRHKFRKQLYRKKRVYTKSRNVLSGVKRKDFAWGGKSGNPLKQQTKSMSFRIKLELTLLLLSLCSIFGVTMFHSFFQVSEFVISGNDRITTDEISLAVHGTMLHREFFVFPAKSYFLVRADEIGEILSNRFPLNAVSVTKVFPNSLHIHMEERLSTVIYDNGATYYFMGLTGKIVEPIRTVTDAEWNIETVMTTSTNDLGEEIVIEEEISRSHTPDVQSLLSNIGTYPIVVQTDTGTSTISLHDQILPGEYIDSIMKWYEFIEKQPKVSMQYIDVDSFHNSIIHTNGADIHVSLVGDTESQMSRFQTAMQEVQSVLHLSYIDIRYPGRVYWK